MKTLNGLILDVPPYLKPSYRISPFETKYLSIHYNNSKKKKDSRINRYFDIRFPNQNHILTLNARGAIEQAIQILGLSKNDTVTIFTTTNNLYISSCVTNVIEKYCQWNREINNNTKAILLNHEFGYCIENINYYKSLNIPIIEDFAHSFDANNSTNTATTSGDFLVFSLSKYFPSQLGGVLVYNKEYQLSTNIDPDTDRYIANSISPYIEQLGDIKKIRLKNYHYFCKLFKTINIYPHFKLEKDSIPAVFCFDVPTNIDLNKLKIYTNNHGIESSVFYGTNAFFVPSHQNLKHEDIYYIFTVIKNFMDNYNEYC
jgi:hypothetical protein